MTNKKIDIYIILSFFFLINIGLILYWVFDGIKYQKEMDAYIQHEREIK